MAHGKLILQNNDNATVVAADLCKPETVLSPAVTEFLDFTQPIGLLMVAVFHFVPDERHPADIIARYRDALPPGSLLALSHLTADHKPTEMAGVVEAMKNSRDPMYFRPYDAVLPLFEGFDLVEPGLVSAPQWHPDPDAPTDTTEGVYAASASSAKPTPTYQPSPTPPRCSFRPSSEPEHLPGRTEARQVLDGAEWFLRG
ncbi:S-adenosyl methyltransferase [Actinokineospora iranica]|uniref:S-adenosyl methyltransferase n=1 Tax=Actinokineospora iranica TaxID=1271860 RepID=A0A1G6U0H7_9PSEU|nr:S-adenosyl methyltransferase [Actinokineospora iranica]